VKVHSLAGPGLPRLRFRPPRRTIRLRLTLVYGVLFLASAVGLLAITHELVTHPFVGSMVCRDLGTVVPGSPPGDYPNTLCFDPQREQDAAANLHYFLVTSTIALAIMAVVSVALGWLVAGRVLRPLRAMTAATREISERNLQERLGIQGPPDELKDLGDTIDELLARLEGAFDAQRRFVANASHELRTPLTVSRAMLEVALADPALDLDSLRSTCEEVLVAQEHQEQLVEALLTLARSERGLDRRESVDFERLVGQVLQAHLPEAAARGVTVDAALGPALIAGDPRLIERLVVNLVENAIRHNVREGRIGVAVGNRPRCVVFEVSNTGPVVPDDQVGRLLEPFQRLAMDGAAGRDGLGLGLSIVAAVATAHAAAMRARPGPDGGLHVEVCFPSLASPPSVDRLTRTAQ